MRFGVPQVGTKNKKGEYLENNQTEPDYLVKNDPESTAKVHEKQIEKADEVMLKQLGEEREDSLSLHIQAEVRTLPI